MKRSPFKPKLPPPRPARQCDYRPRPREAAVGRDAGIARLCVPVPKFAYLRDERFRDLCRAMPCQHCGAAGPDAGVTWAHSNQGQHGHARSIKASDQFVAALCWVCHRELDQGNAWDKAEKVRVWNRAHARTVALAVSLGHWPRDVAVPEIESNPFEELSPKPFVSDNSQCRSTHDR